MKKITLSCFLFLSLVSNAQEKFTAHLDNPNEVGLNLVGIRNDNFLPGVYYERQLDHHFSLGATIGYSTNSNNSNYYYSDEDSLYYENDYYENDYYDNNGLETFNFNIYGRYYLKDYITESFLYLFFDHNVKVRYFLESTAGMAVLKNKFTETIKDTNNVYTIQRTTHNFTDATLGVGTGLKLLFNRKISLEMHGGGGSYLFNNKQAKSYLYFNLGLGYRF